MPGLQVQLFDSGTLALGGVEVPVPFFLIDLPGAGPFLVDTGLDPRLIDHARESLGAVSSRLYTVRMTPDQAASELVRVYDFSAVRTVVDVGGAHGVLLTAVLRANPAARGILFDLPHVVRDAPALIQQRGLADRIRINAGNFFESVPAGADAYVLSHIIHDWHPEQCLIILGHCRRAIHSGGRLLLVEMVLPDSVAPHPCKMLDMVMLTATGGEERTASQYRALLDQAGFEMTRVVPTASLATIVEAVPR